VILTVEMCQSLEALVLEKNVGIPEGLLRLFESRNRRQTEGLPSRQAWTRAAGSVGSQSPRIWCRSPLRIAQLRS